MRPCRGRPVALPRSRATTNPTREEEAHRRERRAFGRCTSIAHGCLSAAVNSQRLVISASKRLICACQGTYYYGSGFTELAETHYQEAQVDEGTKQKPGWSLIWSDEFEGAAGTAVDSAVWRPEIGGSSANQELQYYTGGTKNAALDGESNLAIKVHRPDERIRKANFNNYEYTSARLITKGQLAFTYGLVEARIKLPEGRGMWPAFWLLGQNIDDVGWPQCGEIDVMENFGKDKTVVHGTVHGPGYSGFGGVTAAHHVTSSLADDFHLYAVRWEPNRIRWYFDNTLYSTVTPLDLGGKPWVFDHDFYLLFNVAVGGEFSERPDRSVTFPQTMLVDYVRVYTTAEN